MNDDRILIARSLKGDQESFRELVETYQGLVYNLTFRMLGEASEAEDAAQEAFLRVYQHLADYDQARSFKTWVLSIASNHCIDRIRKRRLKWLSLDDVLPPHSALNSPEPGPEEVALNGERTLAIHALLEHLAPEYRAAVVLRYWYDMSYTEIAETLDTTESAVKSRLFRARQTLAEHLSTSEQQAVVMTMEGT